MATNTGLEVPPDSPVRVGMEEKIPSQSEEATSPFNDQTNYVPVKTIITIFLACASVDLLALMDQTTLAASLTIVSKDLGASSESAWIAGAYFLTSTSFQLLYGRLSDIWSRKVLLVVGIGIFFFGSLAASLAQSALQLIVFRAFMGVGGGGLMTVAQMIVSDIVPLRERGKYQGILESSGDRFLWGLLSSRQFYAPRLEIFKSKLVNGAALTMFVNGWNFLVQIYYIPSFYQLVYGYSAVKSGALLLPITLTQTLFSTLSGLVVHWTGRYRECLLLGWAVWAIGLGLISTLDSPSLGKQIGYGLLAGLGLGNTLQPSLIAVQAGVERKHMAVVTSTRNFVRNLGGTLGLAISGTIINNAVRHSLIPYGLSRSEIQLVLDSPDLFRESFGQERTETIRAALTSAYQQGFRVIFVVGAALNAVAFIAAWFMMPQVELNREDDAQLKAEGKMRDEEKRKKTPKA
ncbi:MFS general substrate transporter [Stemphylium lycopersici]|nr:MFS general substrate transporter [Stemphylium lycopersici]